MNTPAEASPAFEDFYTRRIPEQFNRALDEQRASQSDARTGKILEAMQAVNAAIRIRVLEPPAATAREFVLEIEAGQMTGLPATTPPKHPLLFTLEHDERAFEVLRDESGDSILGFLAGMAGVGTELRLTRARVAQLREIEGSIRFERSGLRPFTLQLHFREPASEAPDCCLRMDDATHQALRTGQLDAQDAFLTEQVAVEGDMQMAMQIAMAFISPDE